MIIFNLHCFGIICSNQYFLNLIHTRRSSLILRNINFGYFIEHSPLSIYYWTFAVFPQQWTAAGARQWQRSYITLTHGRPSALAGGQTARAVCYHFNGKFLHGWRHRKTVDNLYCDNWDKQAQPREEKKMSHLVYWQLASKCSQVGVSLGTTIEWMAHVLDLKYMIEVLAKSKEHCQISLKTVASLNATTRWHRTVKPQRRRIHCGTIVFEST